MSLTAVVFYCLLLLELVNCGLLPSSEKEKIPAVQNRIKVSDEDIVENLRRLQIENQKKRCENCLDSYRCKVQGKCQLCGRLCKDFVDATTISPAIAPQPILGLRLLKGNDISHSLDNHARLYTVGSFGRGPKKNLLAKLLNITEKDDLDQLVILAKSKSTNIDKVKDLDRLIIIDTANIFGETEIESQIHKVSLSDNEESGINLAEEIEHKLDLELQKAKENQLTDGEIDQIIADALSCYKEDTHSNLETPFDAKQITTKRGADDVPTKPSSEVNKQPIENGMQITKSLESRDASPSQLSEPETIFEISDDNNQSLESANQQIENEKDVQPLEETDIIVTATHIPDANETSEQFPEHVGAINPVLLNKIKPSNEQNVNSEGIIEKNLEEIKELINGAQNKQDGLNGRMNNKSQINANDISLILQNLEKKVENVADLVKKTCGKNSDSEVLTQLALAKPKDLSSFTKDKLPDSPTDIINNALGELKKDTELTINDAKQVAEKLNDKLIKQVESKVSENLTETTLKSGTSDTGGSFKEEGLAVNSRSNFENNVTADENTKPTPLETKNSELTLNGKGNADEAVGCSKEEEKVVVVEHEPQYRKADVEENTTHQPLSDTNKNLDNIKNEPKTVGTPNTLENKAGPELTPKNTEDTVGCSKEDDVPIYSNPQYRESLDAASEKKSNNLTPDQDISFKSPTTSNNELKNEGQVSSVNETVPNKDTVGCSEEVVHVYTDPQYRESDGSNIPPSTSTGGIDQNLKTASVVNDAPQNERIPPAQSSVKEDKSNADFSTLTPQSSNLFEVKGSPQGTIGGNTPQFFKTKTKPKMEQPVAMSNEKSAAANRETPQNQEFQIPNDEDASTDEQKNEPSLQQRFGDQKSETLGSPLNLVNKADNTELHQGSSIEEYPRPHPLTTFGKIIAQTNNTELPFNNVSSNKIYFMGNGMQLPLNLKKGRDGSLQLSVDVDSLCPTCTKESCKRDFESSTNTQELQKPVRKQIINELLSDSDTQHRQSELSKRSPNFRLPLPILSYDFMNKRQSKEDEASNKKPFEENFKQFNRNMEPVFENGLKINDEYRRRNWNELDNSKEVKSIPQRRALLLNNVLKWMKDVTVESTTN